MFLTRVVALMGALALAACGSGGHGGSVSPAPASTSTTAAAVSAQGYSTSFTFNQAATAAPVAAKRHSQYVGAGTQSVTITLADVNGAPATGAQNTVRQNVVLTGCPCTIAGPGAPVGADVFSISTYDGQFLASMQNGNLISSATAPVTVSANGANAIAITLNGVPASFTVGTFPSGAAGTAFAAPAPTTVTARDTDGNTILGTYANPVVISDTDTSGATTVAATGSDSPPAGQILSSGDAVTVNYTGLAIPSATIAFDAPSATPANVQFTPTLQPIVQPAWNLAINQVQNSVPFVLSEVGWTNAPYNRSLSASTNCSNLANVAPAAGTSFTLHSGNSLVAGMCTLTISDFTGGNLVTAPVSYSVHGSVVYNVTGGGQNFVVPAGITSVTINIHGAQGGNTNFAIGGGDGGSTQATVPVTPGETLAFFIGGMGQYHGGNGYNGGGNAVSVAASGGGASDVREGGIALANRILVAGGGGGAAGYGGMFAPAGGAGGNIATGGVGYGPPNGIQGGGAVSTVSPGSGGAAGMGTGATAGATGSLGAGGAGGPDTSLSGTDGGGGGGGYYGGGGGGSGGMFNLGGGGGGGTSFVEASGTAITFSDGVAAGDGQGSISW